MVHLAMILAVAVIILAVVVISQKGFLMKSEDGRQEMKRRNYYLEADIVALRQELGEEKSKSRKLQFEANEAVRGKEIVESILGCWLVIDDVAGLHYVRGKFNSILPPPYKRMTYDFIEAFKEHKMPRLNRMDGVRNFLIERARNAGFISADGGVKLSVDPLPSYYSEGLRGSVLDDNVKESEQGCSEAMQEKRRFDADKMFKVKDDKEMMKKGAELLETGVCTLERENKD